MHVARALRSVRYDTHLSVAAEHIAPGSWMGVFGQGMGSHVVTHGCVSSFAMETLWDFI